MTEKKKKLAINEKLYGELRKHCEKLNVPLIEYVEGNLETSIYFPDGIELPASYSPKALREKAKKEGSNEVWETIEHLFQIVDCQGCTAAICAVYPMRPVDFNMSFTCHKCDRAWAVGFRKLKNGFFVGYKRITKEEDFYVMRILGNINRDTV